MEEKGKYGLATAISMVVGSVIGSGVFFKTESLINITKGDGREVLIAWITGGIGMLMCLLSFSYTAMYTGSENGLTGIAEQTVGRATLTIQAGLWQLFITLPLQAYFRG